MQIVDYETAVCIISMFTAHVIKDRFCIYWQLIYENKTGGTG